MRYLLHKLFGFEYASVHFGYDDVIRRIHTAKDGTRYVFAYGTLIKEGTRNWMQLL